MKPFIGICWVMSILLGGILAISGYTSKLLVDTSNPLYFLLGMILNMVYFFGMLFYIVPSDDQWINFKPKNKFESLIMHFWCD